MRLKHSIAFVTALGLESYLAIIFLFFLLHHVLLNLITISLIELISLSLSFPYVS